MRRSNEGKKRSADWAKTKKEDLFELPMDDLFFDQMHDKIMKAVELTEIKSQTKWTKSWIFLETQSHLPGPAPERIIKSALVMGFATLSLGLGSLSLGLFQQTHDQQVSAGTNKRF